MNKGRITLISVIVPVYNESAGLRTFHETLLPVVKSITDNYEILYCDDGSTDDTSQLIHEFIKHDPKIKLIRLARNFGKECALTAGIAQAHGKALIMLDGDGQHPVELLPKFVEAWRAGSQVVIGFCNNRRSKGLFKSFGSRIFYRVLNMMTGQKLLHGTTDFRLIDQEVQQAFLQLKETDRITRGLIDWLGFKRVYVEYAEKVRSSGHPSYSRRKLVHLAANSFVSLSPTPLYLFGYLGIIITAMSLMLGLAVIIEQLLLGDPWHWKFTGTAMLGILILFLVGMVLMSQAVLSLYISRIYNQSRSRPLYVIDFANSVGLTNKETNAER